MPKIPAMSSTFFRFHNGTLLDRRQHGSGPHLELRGLREAQAGEYHCKAWNEAGAVRSRAAQLTVLGERPGLAPPEPSPRPQPQSPSLDLVVWNPQLPASQPATPGLRNT